MRFLPLVLVLLACNGDKDDDNYLPPSIVTDALESGVTGESYATWLEVQGGEAPLRWEITGDLPTGLVFNPAGAISGIPSRPEDVTVTVKVTDERGESDSVEMSLAVALALNALPCGVTVGGEFAASAAVDDYYEIDWNAEDGYTWLQVPLPEDDTTRIDLEFDAFGSYFEVYLASPGTPVGDQDLYNNYRLYYAGFGDAVTVDLGTSYDLQTYQSFGDAINVLVVATDASAWEATTVCSNGPIFDDLLFYPTLLGDDLFVNFNIIGENEGVRIWTDDTLPDWVSWDEATGRLTGVAGDLGAFEFDVHAEDAEGRVRTERAGFGVFDYEYLACDEPYRWTPSQGYYETYGAFYNFYNVNAFKVFRVETDPRYSQITAHLDGLSGGDVGFTGPDSFAFYIDGPSDGDWSGSDFSASVSPQSMPSLGEYTDVQPFLSAVGYGYFGTSSEATFWYECDPAPRPDLRVFPVLDPTATQSWSYDVIGGVAPYIWSTTGLPDGVTLDENGQLNTDFPVEGEYPVTVTVQDDTGRFTDIDLDLFVGDDAACMGYPQLSCGDAEAGSFTDTFYNNPNGGAAVYCMDSSTFENDNLVVTVTAGVDAQVAVVATTPGIDPFLDFMDFEYTFIAFADPEEVAVGVFDHSMGLQNYEDQVVFLSALAWSPGVWSFDVECN